MFTSGIMLTALLLQNHLW